MAKPKDTELAHARKHAADKATNSGTGDSTRSGARDGSKGEATAHHDVALLHGPTEDGKGARIVRLRDGELSVGEVRPVVEGTPLNGQEVVRLRGRREQPGLCDVDVLYSDAGRARQSSASQSAGPPRVSTDAYRRGWGQVFTKRKRDDGSSDRSLN